MASLYQRLHLPARKKIYGLRGVLPSRQAIVQVVHRQVSVRNTLVSAGFHKNFISVHITCEHHGNLCCKALLRVFDVQIKSQQHLYTAGFAVYIRLPQKSAMGGLKF